MNKLVFKAKLINLYYTLLYFMRWIAWFSPTHDLLSKRRLYLLWLIRMTDMNRVNNFRRNFKASTEGKGKDGESFLAGGQVSTRGNKTFH